MKKIQNFNRFNFRQGEKVTNSKLIKVYRPIKKQLVIQK